MEKLTLEHLAGYLPYGLRIKANSTNHKETYTLLSLDTLGFGFEEGELFLKRCIPILRPLSDLTKEIEHNGEKFVPIYKIREEFVIIDGNHRHFDYPLTLDGMNCGILSLPYWVIQKLQYWHFDIHGLIDKNLAIDINTL